MRATRDSFLHFLSDNLVPQGIPVYNLRRQPDNVQTDLTKSNGVNVEFFDTFPTLAESETMVEISVINDDELTCVDWVSKVFKLLSSAYLTPKYDYTVPASPVSLGTNIYWNIVLQFRRIYSDSFADYRVVISLKHHVE